MKLFSRRSFRLEQLIALVFAFSAGVLSFQPIDLRADEADINVADPGRLSKKLFAPEIDGI